MTRPYGDFAQAYFDAGWQPFPLPAGKKFPPPDGYTGHYGKDVTQEDVTRWIEECPEANIGVRLPDGVLGIDADLYDGKHGARTLAEAEAQCGPLPDSPRLTARTDGSGIRFYRVPTGLGWRGVVPGGDVEVIQRGHRYAVAYPSIHPKTGTPYGWVGVNGIPRVADLPELPSKWVGFLSTGEASILDKVDQTDSQVVEWLGKFQDGPMCARVLAARDDADFTDAGSRHDVMLKVVFELVRLGQEGHRGAREGLAETQKRFYTAIKDRDAAGEFHRALKGAVEKSVKLDLLPPCDCLAKDEEPAAKKQSALQWLRSITMRRDQLRNMPPPEALIEGLLQMDSLAWIYGAPSSAKTFMALDWACSIASGRRDWCGFPVKRPGPVMYVAGEGVRGVALRVNAWETANNATAEDLYVVPEPVQVSKDEYLHALTTVAKEIGAVLLVLDTQARMSVGVDENGATEMGQFIEQIEKLRRETGACILTVHHSRKDGETERGSGAIRGAATTMIQMSGKKKEYRRLEVNKQKDIEELDEDLSFELVDVEGTGSAVLVRRHYSSEAPEPDGNAQGASALTAEGLADIGL